MAAGVSKAKEKVTESKRQIQTESRFETKEIRRPNSDEAANSRRKLSADWTHSLKSEWLKDI